MKKTCRSCWQEKEGSLFHPYKRNRDGLQSYCKACQIDKRKAKYRSSPEQYREDALKRYYAKKSSGAIDKQAKAKYDRAYRLSNDERLRQVKELWRAKNLDLIRLIRASYKARRRAIEKSGDPTSVIRLWLKDQPKVCRWCGSDCSNGFHLDHIKPLAKGGKHVVANLCVSCPTCNVKKNAKDPDIWSLEIGKNVAMLEREAA